MILLSKLFGKGRAGRDETSAAIVLSESAMPTDATVSIADGVLEDDPEELAAVIAAALTVYMSQSASAASPKPRVYPYTTSAAWSATARYDSTRR